jgi:hypothetical protein
MAGGDESWKDYRFLAKTLTRIIHAFAMNNPG